MAARSVHVGRKDASNPNVNPCVRSWKAAVSKRGKTEWTIFCLVHAVVNSARRCLALHEAAIHPIKSEIKNNGTCKHISQSSAGGAVYPGRVYCVR